jgi:hypothetical protein
MLAVVKRIERILAPESGVAGSLAPFAAPKERFHRQVQRRVVFRRRSARIAGMLRARAAEEGAFVAFGVVTVTMPMLMQRW